MNVKILDAVIADAQAFLSRARNAKARIAAKQARIENWRRLAESVSAPLKHDPGLSRDGYKQSLIENAVCNIVDFENEIIAEIKELINLERDICAAINVLAYDDKHIAVLEMRYLNGYTWSVIAKRLGFGADWVCRLHSSALREMRRNAKRYR